MQSQRRKPFSCRQCDRSFTRAENLARHEVSHQTILPHKCDSCGRGFTRKDLRDKHKLVHRKRGLASKNQVSEKLLQTPEGSNHQPQQEINHGAEYVGHHNASNIAPSPLHEQTLASLQPTWVDRFPETAQHFQNDQTTSHDLHQAAGIMSETMNTPPWTTFPPLGGSSVPFPWSCFEDEAFREWSCTEFDDSVPNMSIEDGSSGLLASVTTTTLQTEPNMQSPRLTSPVSADHCSDQVPEEDYRSVTSDPSTDRGDSSIPVIIAPGDPILDNHLAKFDITESVHSELVEYLQPSSPLDDGRRFILPNLLTTNYLIGLFFRHSLPQMPILHVATTSTNSLPMPLLAMMVVIGASYSHLNGSRSLVLSMLDRTRRKLHMQIENDHKLIRDPLVIYSSLLICYVGVWSSDLRAFGSVDLHRAALVNYIRQRPSLTWPPTNTSSQHINAQWHQWARYESQKRLMWSIYRLDAEFPVLLNAPATMSLKEVLSWECPCDDRFWSASSSTHWKGLLGSAPWPPSPRFALAVAPFLLITRHFECLVPPVPIFLNNWSSFLVIMAIATQIFDEALAQDMISELKMTLGDLQEAGKEKSIPRGVPSDDTRSHLIHYLELWHLHYGDCTPSRSDPEDSEAHFHDAAMVIRSISRLILEIPLNDLQAIMGKWASHGMQVVMARLRASSMPAPADSSVQPCDHFAVTAGVESIRIINHVTKRFQNQDILPVHAITFFLAHISIWAVLAVLPTEYRSLLWSRAHQEDCCSAIPTTLSRFFDSREESPHDIRLVFQSGARLLLRCRGLGVAASLGRFLMWRSQWADDCQPIAS